MFLFFQSLDDAQNEHKKKPLVKFLLSFVQDFASLGAARVLLRFGKSHHEGMRGVAAAVQCEGSSA